MAEAIRLIIWDLDDTFWRGTLTEGGIAYQRHIHDIVIALARRGIISTICSKNDLAPVRDILQAQGLWDYFVMPSINWEPKGQRIAALAAMVREFDVQCALIRVTDRYGDYGFCGFYLTRGSLRGRQLQHFCFSCRILNMGVEAWVYAQLGRPGLVVAGEVIGTVESPEPVDWISFGPAVAADAAAAAATTTTTTTTTTRELGDVFIHGGCDLAAVSHYFGMVSRRVSGAFNAVRGGVDLRFDHSQFLAYAAAGLDAPQRAAAALLGYQAADFDASLWQDAAGAGLWLLSLWADAHFLLYRHGETGLTLPFTVPVHVPGTGHADLTRIDAASLGERVTQSWVGEALGHLQRAFTCVGLTPQPLFQANLRRLLAVAPADALVFILGANEQEMPQARFVGPKVQAHRALNRWTAEVCQEFAQARLINIRDFVRDESEVLNLNHFDRMVYYRIYEHVLAAVRQHRAPAAASLAHSAAA